jgi:predicted amidohydrolase
MPRARKRIVRVGLVKAESAWADVKRNVQLLEKLCEPLTQSRIDVLVTPECFLDGYLVRDRKRRTKRRLLACSVTGGEDPLVRRVAALAAALKSYLVLGASEKDSKNRIRNAAYLIGRAGNHVGTYYKVHPDKLYEPGDELPVFKTDFGVVGIVICADRRWPENIRTLRLKGAEIMFNPTWGWYGEGNTAIMRTRAYENGVPVCFAHPRQSLICSPDGNVAAILESNCPSILVHDVDLSKNPRPRATRDKSSSHPIQNRRPELYGPIAERRCPPPSG